MKTSFAFLFVVIGLSAPTLAQPVGDSLRYAESIWSMEKKAMILEELNLPEADKSSFWAVYESYSNAIQYMEMEYIRLQNLMTDEGMSETKLASLTESMLSTELMLAKTRKYYYKKFRKALNASVASRFMQLDSEFRTLIRMQMKKESPALTTSVDKISIQ